MANELETDKESVRFILVNNMGIRKVYAKTLSRLLIQKQKSRRLNVCQDIFQQLEAKD